MVDVSVSRFIRERRDSRKISQKELAELAGVGQRFVSELERGKPTVRVAEVNKVLAVFGKRLGIVDRPRSDIDESTDESNDE
jgi:y4mF family transcriptional regulator